MFSLFSFNLLLASTFEDSDRIKRKDNRRNRWQMLNRKKGKEKNTFSWLGGSCFMIDLIDIIAWIKTPASPSTDSKSLAKKSAVVGVTLKNKKQNLFKDHYTTSSWKQTLSNQCQQPFQACVSHFWKSLCTKTNCSNGISRKSPVWISNIILATH